MTDATGVPGEIALRGLEGLRTRLSRLPLFQGIDRDGLAAIEAELEWFSLPGGWTLFEEGDQANALYVVTYGCLGARVQGDDGRGRLVSTIPAGETVGEMALISGDPRSATVVALRDTELLRLAKPVFERLIERHPKAMLQLMRLLVRRLRLSTSRIAETGAPKTFALIPLDKGVPVAAFVRRLADALTELTPRVRVLDVGAAEQTTEWFHTVEAAHDLILYLAQPEVSPWTRLCLRQADRVLLIAQAGTAPSGRLPIEPALAKASHRAFELVLLQAADALRAEPAAPWLERLPITFHCHIRQGNRADLARLARLLTGRGVGLVLSGGGARGFAHIGVIRALREAGVPLDLLGGTSMGAIIAAGTALEWDDGELTTQMRRGFVETNPLNDYTLPVIALVRGRKVTRLLRDHFGDARLEDLWRPYFCVSSNLTTGHAKEHREGPVWRALRASVAIPGVLPPVVEGGEVLVDGGVINNFPVDVMSAMGRGRIIGVEVSIDRALTAAAEDLETASLWSLFRHGRRSAPGIVSLLMRAGTVSSAVQTANSRGQVDLFLQPPLEAIDIRDWQAFEQAIEAGYRHTMEMLELLDSPAFRDGWSWHQ